MRSTLYRIAVISATGIRSIARHKLRSFLTTLGLVIGVAAVIVSAAIGAGVAASVAEMMRALGSNFIVIIPEAVTQAGARVEAVQSKLTLEDGEAIRRECPSVAYVTPQVRVVTQIIAAERNWGTSVSGVDVEWPFIRAWNVDEGSFFTEADVRGTARVCVFGATVAENLFPDGGAVGALVRIKNLPIRVIGVLERKGGSMSGSDHDDLVIAPYTTVMKQLMGTTRIGVFIASATGPNDVDAAMDEIDSLLRQRHRIGPGAPSDFRLRAQTEIMQADAERARIMGNLLLSIAAISLLVGGIGIMNIMLVSVTERTREIGIRMAIGAKGRHVLLQFLFEAVVLSIVGGLIGIVLGVGVTMVVGKAAGWPIVISPGTIAMAFAVAGSVGVFFGFYPARKAARLDPIDALRYE